MKIAKFITIIAAVAIMTACNTDAMTAEKEETGSFFVTFYRDPVTHVEYVVYSAAYGVAITPRLNADGTVYTKKEG